ncbi:hypothetical protein [Congzhengia minquanensis]|uniref:Uncharacterized protein n=1 Tax=Congzhengia minquanensis TaxID=2763657 RepID=A0A926HZ67_9FIRM|nr:hypothetical protein [Congzhengia minquanensis]MBC8540845.1 hypothetical protein [Congzhengia minquanensis]
MTENDEFKIYRGYDYKISDHITIHQATLNEICDFGEQDYYNMLYNLTATPQTMKVQLWDMGVDYTKISAWQLFYGMLFKLFPKDKTSILFGNLDFQRFEVIQRKSDDSFFLYQKVETHSGIDEIVIDEFTYNIITDYLRQAHYIEKDERVPANETTKMVLIEDAREDQEMNRNKKYHSRLKNLVSAMINCEGFKYSHSQVWDMKINAFMDSVRRISKIKNANLLLQSGYSGFGVNLKEINKKQLDWTGELD